MINLSGLEQQVEAEIFRWYNIFYSWSRGLVIKNKIHIMPIYQALAEDFQVVLTSGELMSREVYWNRLYNLHNTRSAKPPSSIENLKMKFLSENYVLATYDLIKKSTGEKKVNSAILRPSQQQIGPILWMYVHESVHPRE